MAETPIQLITYLSALLCSEVWQRWNRTSLIALLKTYLPDMAFRMAIIDWKQEQT